MQRFVVQSGTVNLTDHPRQPGNQAGSYTSYPLASSRVDYAHAAGLTGAGQTISVIDEGFRQNHEAFAGKTKSSTGAPGIESHGTSVASVAAGNSPSMVGVAPGANLHFGSWDDIDLTAGTLQALALGAVAQNNSWGFPNTPVSQATFNDLFANPASPDMTAYLGALDLYAAQGVVVFAVSNDKTQTTADLLEALPVIRPSLEPGWLAVGNAIPVFDNAGISSAAMVSAGCLEAARWCLVADGFWYAASGISNTSYSQVAGSSFAAPQVSGALALLAEAFPSLGPHQLRVRLLASANNDFSNFNATGTMDLLDGPGVFMHAYSDIFGHGFLDLRAALLPIGPVTMALADGTKTPVANLRMTSGAAMGDAVSSALASVDFAAEDSFAGTFKVSGDSLAGSSEPEALGTKLMASVLGPAKLQGSRPSLFADHQGQSLSLTDAETGQGAELLLPGDGTTADRFGVAFSQPLLEGPVRLDLGLKVARDDGSLMGFAAREGGGADMVSASLTLSRDFDGGAFFGVTAEMGMADFGRPTAIGRVSRVGFDSFAAEIGRRGVFTEGDRLSLSVGLPTAVNSGSASVALPVLSDDGKIVFSDTFVDLAPTQRQVDVAIGYDMPLGRQSDLRIELQHSENYGNRAGAFDTGAALALNFRF